MDDLPKKRGRPRKPDAMTGAERQAKYRSRQKLNNSQLYKIADVIIGNFKQMSLSVTDPVEIATNLLTQLTNPTPRLPSAEDYVFVLARHYKVIRPTQPQWRQKSCGLWSMAEIQRNYRERCKQEIDARDLAIKKAKVNLEVAKLTSPQDIANSLLKFKIKYKAGHLASIEDHLLGLARELGLF